MTWTHDYTTGQEAQARLLGGWTKCTVVAVRSRSVMAAIGDAFTFNIHDPRNIRPCPASTQNQPGLSSKEQPLLDL